MTTWSGEYSHSTIYKTDINANNLSVIYSFPVTIDLYSRAVKRIRQPIESLFNWIIEETDFQIGLKVLST